MKRRSVLSLLLASLLTLSLTSCQDSGESSTAETSPANNSSSSEEAASSESEEEPYRRSGFSPRAEAAWSRTRKPPAKEDS